MLWLLEYFLLKTPCSQLHYQLPDLENVRTLTQPFCNWTWLPCSYAAAVFLCSHLILFLLFWGGTVNKIHNLYLPGRFLCCRAKSLALYSLLFWALLSTFLPLCLPSFLPSFQASFPLLIVFLYILETVFIQYYL